MKKEILLWRQTTTPNSENQPGSFPVDQLELKCWKGVIISVMWATSDWCPVTLLANQGNFETWNIFLSSRLKKPKTLYIHLNLSCANYCIKRRLKADMANNLKRKYSVKCSGAARFSSSLCLNLFSFSYVSSLQSRFLWSKQNITETCWTFVMKPAVLNSCQHIKGQMDENTRMEPRSEDADSLSHFPCKRAAAGLRDAQPSLKM